MVGTLGYRASVAHAPDLLRPVTKDTGHRTVLPAPCPDNSHIGLITILYNNIGKDLSRVSMPAALNEPLCLLQRLCEELEYSELLDIANNTQDPYQRMVTPLSVLLPLCFLSPLSTQATEMSRTAFFSYS